MESKNIIKKSLKSNTAALWAFLHDRDYFRSGVNNLAGMCDHRNKLLYRFIFRDKLQEMSMPCRL